MFMDKLPNNQVHIFDELWNRFSTQLNSGGGIIDIDFEQQGAPRHVTTVVRMPSGIAEACNRQIIELRHHYPNQYYYSPENLHFTILNLDRIFQLPGADKIRPKLIEAIKQSVVELPPLAVAIKGISVFPTAVFAQVFDISGQLEAYRSAMADAATSTLQVGIDVKPLVQHVAFVNLIRFRSIPDASLVDQVAKLRDINVGSFTVENIELVKTDRLLSREATVLETVIETSR